MFAAILTLIVTLAFAAGPFLFPDFDGFAPDRFPIPQTNPPLQPEPFAFGIWGLIYLWLIGSAIFGLWQRRDDADWGEMRPALIMSLALGAAWLALAKENPLIATIMLWGMWATALSALFRAPERDKSWAAWPLGLYAGWLSAAACLATSLVIAGYGLLDRDMTAVLTLGLAIVLAAGFQLWLGRAPTFGLAVIWALVAIYMANDTIDPQIAGLSMGGAIGVGALTLFASFREWRGR